MATATMFKGTYRLVHTDASDMVLKTIVEFHSSSMGDGSTTAPTDPQVMPKLKRMVADNMALAQDEKLKILYKPDATQTEAATGNSITEVIRVPVTFLNVRQGNAFERTLTAGDFTEMRASAASQVWTAGQWYEIKSMTVKAQTQIKTGVIPLDVRVDSAFLIHRQYGA
ncbi:MAG: hypothetical protein PHW63_09285 [Alphaproteobacteria bacterium]|nr:hypothetical protein [Alphaproteobacteria bacterium]